MKRVFVSYSRRNRNFAERLARDLSDAGLEVWIDFRQIHAGEMWQQEIYRGIQRSEMLVLCLSPDAVISEWVQREVQTAREQGKLIIPVMAVNALAALEAAPSMRWLLDVQFINFEGRYEEAFPELLNALPGVRRVGAFDEIDLARIPNPFKGLEAFQQTDARFFFGREDLIRKGMTILADERSARFLAVVGASGSGKSSLVRAGIIPEIREGTLPGSDTWPILILTPGDSPMEAMAQRLSPLLEDLETEQITPILRKAPQNLHLIIERIFADAPAQNRAVIVVDQFEEVFTRAGEAERDRFLNMIVDAATRPGGRAILMITMRADFFDRLTRYPALAQLFEQEHLLIVTEMNAADLLRAIEGPAEAVGLIYEEGLPQRILDDVRRQPGSLPLLQYALKELYERRDGRRLTNAAYDEIGGVRRALARHAEDIYLSLNAAQQAIMKRVLLRLVEVNASGEATRRRVDREELRFRDVPDEVVQEVIDLLTASTTRLLFASREIRPSSDATRPSVTIEVAHEALIREWDRFTGWVAENVENLRFGGELLQSASDWQRSQRDPAYLLTGTRLTRAEEWLETGDPTALQREFVQESIEAEELRREQRQAQAERELRLQRRLASRLRAFVVVLVISLIVAVGLSLVAIAQSLRAERALERAEINEQDALSLALSASASRALSDEDTDLAFMLAVSAFHVDPNPPPQAQRTMAEVIYAPGTRRLFDGLDAEILGIAFSRDGRFAFSTQENFFVIWDTVTAQVITRLGGDGIGHSRPVNDVAISPDGRTIATVGDDAQLILWTWDAQSRTGDILIQLGGHQAQIYVVEFSPDGTQVVTAGEDQRLIVWDAVTGEEVTRMEGHTDAVNALAFDTTGRFILSGSDDGTMRRWTLNGQQQALFDVNSPVTAVAYHPGKDTALTGSEDGNVRLWNLSDATSEVIYSAGANINISALAYDPDSDDLETDLAAVAQEDGILVILNVATGAEQRVYRGHSGSIRELIYSPDGTRLLSGALDGTMRLWDTVSAELRDELIGHSTSPRVRTVVGVYRPEGDTILSASHDRTLRLWSLESRLTIQEYRGGHDAAINTVAVSSDGRLALSGDSAGQIVLWDVASSDIVRTLDGHTGNVFSVIFLPGDTQAVSAAADNTLILWNLETGEIERRFTGHTDLIYDVALRPGTSQMISASGDRTLILWNLETGEAIRRFEGQGSSIRTVAISPDGHQVVSGAANGSVFLWNAQTGEPIREFEGHTGAVLGVDFSPQGRQFVSGSLDGTLRVWDVLTRIELRRYTVPAAARGVSSVVFSPDGREMLTGSINDATLRVWRVLLDVNELVDWAYINRFIALPTCDERVLFNIPPQCIGRDTPPVVTPYPIPTQTPLPPDAPVLVVGGTAVINTDDGDVLFVRANPNLSSDIVARLDDGAQVTLMEGPRESVGLIWWRVRTRDGLEGWSAQSLPEEGLQMLVPIQQGTS
jgi:WD40 repeat protein